MQHHTASQGNKSRVVPCAMDGFRDEAADDDAFLDRLTGQLDAIVRECATIGRTDDAAAALAKASSAFQDVQRMCQQAGIVHAEATQTDSGESQKERTAHGKERGSLVVPMELTSKASPLRSPHFTLSKERPAHKLNLAFSDTTSQLGDDESLPPPTPLRYRAPFSLGDDIIEVEITDILTSTQEEIQRWKHEFRLEMMEQEARHHEQTRAHLEQIQGLKDVLDDSQRHIATLHRDVHDTNTKLEAMQALTNKSQKAMELTLREHTQYWKAICHDLVAEKKAIATKLAEERGKNHSLREHLGMHSNNQSKSAAEARSSSPPSSSSRNKTSQGDTSPIADQTAQSVTTSRFHSATKSLFDTEVLSQQQPHASFRRYYLTKKPSSAK